MNARIAAPSPEALARAADLLRAGELVAFPTETVYGLGADASRADAVARIYAAKGRPNDHPVIVHVAVDADLSRWARHVPPAARTLIDRFWPGPLTLVMARADGVLDAITGGQDTVALRSPSHPVAQAMLRAFDGGVAGPSANRFGRVSPTTAGHVDGEFGPELTLILDGGPCDVGIESTIVDVSGTEPVLLRPGHIGLVALSEALGYPVLTRDQAAARKQAEAPRVSGALAAHYAPRTPLALVTPAELADWVARRTESGQRVGVWSAQAVPVDTGIWQVAPADPVAYAHALYATLRQLDGLGMDQLVVAAPPSTPDWAAIHDRLGRAAVGSGAAD